MKNFFSNLFSFFSHDWWVKITTSEPNCIYYFGPFSSEDEALQARPGYIEDLEGEGAERISTSLQQSSEPENLTIEMGSTATASMMASV